MALDFTIVVPTFGRPAQLTTCLAALGRLAYPLERFEVVVVDDGGAPAVPAWSGTLPVTVLRQDNAGPAAARNAGAAVARGRWLAFTDDDCAPTAGWLTAFRQALEEAPEAVVGGRTENLLTDQACAEASQLLISYLYTSDLERYQEPRFFTSNNFAVAAARFHELGGFDPRYRRAAGEDRQFCADWRARGWPVRYLPGAVVGHAHGMTVGGFWRQHFAYGRAAHQFHLTRATRDGDRLRIEPWSYYRRLLTFPHISSHPAPWRMSTLLFLSQVANAAGFLCERLFSDGRPVAKGTSGPDARATGGSSQRARRL